MGLGNHEPIMNRGAPVKYLRLDRSKCGGFLQAARALLDAGASAKTGFFSQNHQPEPEFESVLYGAAGIAHNAHLPRLLLERYAISGKAILRR